MISIKSKSLAVGMLLVLTTQTYGQTNELNYKYKSDEEKKAQAWQEVKNGAVAGFVTGLITGIAGRVVLDSHYSNLNESTKKGILAGAAITMGSSVKLTMDSNEINSGWGTFVFGTAIGTVIGSMFTAKAPKDQGMNAG
jgi:hypothetical protein